MPTRLVIHSIDRFVYPLVLTAGARCFKLLFHVVDSCNTDWNNIPSKTITYLVLLTTRNEGLYSDMYMN